MCSTGGSAENTDDTTNGKAAFVHEGNNLSCADLPPSLEFRTLQERRWLSLICQNKPQQEANTSYFWAPARHARARSCYGSLTRRSFRFCSFVEGSLEGEENSLNGLVPKSRVKTATGCRTDDKQLCVSILTNSWLESQYSQ